MEPSTAAVFIAGDGVVVEGGAEGIVQSAEENKVSVFFADTNETKEFSSDAVKHMLPEEGKTKSGYYPYEPTVEDRAFFAQCMKSAANGWQRWWTEPGTTLVLISVL